MSIRTLAALALTVIASSAVAAEPAERKCGAGSCSKKNLHKATAPQASCSKKDAAGDKEAISTVAGKDASCSKKEAVSTVAGKDASCSKKEAVSTVAGKDASCSKKEASCSKKDTPAKEASCSKKDASCSKKSGS